jgi:hypothetical protein
MVMVWRSWIERRHAGRTARKVLELYRSVSASRPELVGRPLLREVVMRHARCDAARADEMLDFAEESFTAWPVERELTLGDVAHYLSVVDFVATHGEEPWRHSHIGHVVTSQIPRSVGTSRH